MKENAPLLLHSYWFVSEEEEKDGGNEEEKSVLVFVGTSMINSRMNCCVFTYLSSFLCT